jgi:hypothetical protein
MKALTIWQPWASLIIAGAKSFEWRTWPPPASLIGQRLAIHAGARKVEASDILQILDLIEAGESSLVGDIAGPLLRRVPLGAWPRSSVLGTAIVCPPISAAEYARKYSRRGQDSTRIDHHQLGWPLRDIERFEPPVPARGAQGLWDWTPPEAFAEFCRNLDYRQSHACSRRHARRSRRGAARPSALAAQGGTRARHPGLAAWADHPV